MSIPIVPSDKPRISIYLSPEQKEAVNNWADENSRPVSAQFCHWIDECLINQRTYMLTPREGLREKLISIARKKGVSIETLIEWLLAESINNLEQDS